MRENNGLRLSCAIGLLALAATCNVALAANAKDAAVPSKESALPQPLARETLLELVSRMSDDDVNKLLREQSGVSVAAAPAAGGKSGMGMAGAVEARAGAMRDVYNTLKTAALEMPQTFRSLGEKVFEPEGVSRVEALGGLLIAMLGAGWLAEAIYNRLIRGYRSGLRPPDRESFSEAVAYRTIKISLELAKLALFAAVAISMFFLLWQDDHVQRIAILSVLLVVIAFRAVALFARLLLAPNAPSDRLLPFDDAAARILYRFVLTFTTIHLIGTALMHVMRAGDSSDASIDVVWLTVVPLFVALVIVTVWRVRVPIAGLIRGNGKHGVIRNWAAELWALIATLYFLGVGAGRVFGVLAGDSTESGTAALSVLLVVAIPIVDLALCRTLAAAANASSIETGRRIHGFIADFELVFRRAIHIVVIVAGLLIFGYLWDLDAFALAQRSMGGKISSSLLGIAIVLLLAYMVWEVAKTAIDRRLDAESDVDEKHPQSRLQTVLPIIRGTVLVTVSIMAIMSILAALGVDILPLLAGASVVGVAIGFGSQTLVRDIVSGAFFLMDDAFRLGEYIEVGDAKGRVEKINVRTIFLRHHRGAINILPYGEIKRLRNTSRDWVVHVLDFRLTYDTNLATVKKILKDVGAEIAADTELAPDLLQPLKLGGVQSAEDSAVIVRAKFTARPEGEPWMIRKTAYQKILKAFRENGIKFAHREVTVNVPTQTGDEGTMRALAGGAGGAALLEAQRTDASR